MVAADPANSELTQPCRFLQPWPEPCPSSQAEQLWNNGASARFVEAAACIVLHDQPSPFPRALVAEVKGEW